MARAPAGDVGIQMQRRARGAAREGGAAGRDRKGRGRRQEASTSRPLGAKRRGGADEAGSARRRRGCLLEP